jgi:hypothetical protein
MSGWLSWVIDHHFPAVAFAVLLVGLLILELRRPPS